MNCWWNNGSANIGYPNGNGAPLQGEPLVLSPKTKSPPKSPKVKLGIETIPSTRESVVISISAKIGILSEQQWTFLKHLWKPFQIMLTVGIFLKSRNISSTFIDVGKIRER